MSSITGINAYRFRIPFRRNVILAGTPVSQREGILLQHNGRWAEASPLPGFSSESVDDVIAALRGDYNNKPGPAALSFALSSLVEPMPTRLQVPLNGLLLGDETQILTDAKKCSQRGFEAVKLKVGRNTLDSEIRLVRQVRDLLAADIRLRLDANQAWTFEEADEFFTRLEDANIEYVEEPLQDPDQLEKLFAKTGIGYALDESLKEGNSLEKWPNVKALICKPTILGGRKAIEGLGASETMKVFSSAFESGVGIARIMQLAAEFSPGTPAGLDTLAYMQDDLLIRPPSVRNGSLILEEFAVNCDSLERLLP